MNKRLVIQLARYFLALCCLVALGYSWLHVHQEVTAEVVEVQTAPQGALLSNYLKTVLFAIGVLVFLLPEVLFVFSYPIRAFFSGLFFPEGNEVAPPDYNLPQVYREQGRYDEAIEQYMKIIKNHPEELLAYIGAIQCAHLAGNFELAEKIAKKGAHLKTPGAQEQIAYALQNPPEVVEEEENEEELPPWYRQQG